MITIRGTIIINDDDFGALVDKPKVVRCLEDELAGPINIIPRVKQSRKPFFCRHCNKDTTSPERECFRIACISTRSDA